MDNKEILENRQGIILAICQHIRHNHFKLINAKNFSERPYLDGEIKRKFNTLNYLRLLAAERSYNDLRWFSLHIPQKSFLLLKLTKKNIWNFILKKCYNSKKVLELINFCNKNIWRLWKNFTIKHFLYLHFFYQKLN